MSTAKTYCWIGNDGGWKIGRKTDICGKPGRVQMQDYHSGVVSLVQSRKIKLYPQSPIPEPTK